MGLSILQFGRTGQVGLELLTRAAGRGHRITALGRDAVDLAEPKRIAWAVGAAGPVDIVINGAAYTAVDKAESEPERADTVNAQGVAVLAETCARRKLPLIHLSTDYVFDGTKTAPYTEDDAPNPINAYGRSKLKGEALLRERHARHIILRTSWVYSAFGANFVTNMLRLGRERDELRIVDDQHGAPTAAAEIAEACLSICERLTGGLDDAWGTYHFAAAGATTWCGFAQEIFARAPWAGIKARIVPITTADYPTPACRPLNSRLDCSKLARVFGIIGRPWQDGLAEVMAKLEHSR